MNKLVKFYSNMAFYFSAWEIVSVSLKSKEEYKFKYIVTIANDVYVAYIKSSAQSSCLITQFQSDVNNKEAFSIDNRDGKNIQNEFDSDEFINRLTGVSLCFALFVPGCILAGSSAYKHLNVNIIKKKDVFYAKKCCKDFLILSGKNGQICEAKYILGEAEVHIKNIDEFTIKK